MKIKLVRFPRMHDITRLNCHEWKEQRKLIINGVEIKLFVPFHIQTAIIKYILCLRKIQFCILNENQSYPNTRAKHRFKV